jgi:hypothetical protein
MSIQYTHHPEGIVTIELTGKLHQPELAAMQRTLAAKLADGEKIALVIDGRAFQGWSNDGDWSNLEAQYALDPKIRKMAIIADPAWSALADAFTGKKLRPFPIEMFAPADVDQALAWASEA